MRRILVSIGIVSLCFAVDASAAKRYQLNLPEQNVAESLTQLSEQTQTMLLFSYEMAETLQASPVTGRYTLQQALDIMLAETAYSGGLTKKGVLMISLKKSSDILKKAKGEDSMNRKRKLLAASIGFFAGVGASQGLLAQEEGANQVSLLEEIVVTATKRETSLQDTAIAMSAIGGEEIDKRNLVGMADYLSFIPGVSMQDRGAGQNDIVIRGTSVGNQLESNSATGLYFGETPVTGLGSPLTGQASGSADIKMVDIERVEVLRGPQGTLYGAGSMGGTVRVIPNKPVLSEFEGKVAARYSQTGERGGDNTMVQGVLNLPIIDDQLAVRAVVYQFDNDGYIDNIAGSQSDSGVVAERITQGGIAVDRKVGGDKYTGTRLSALWQPIEEFSATLSYLNQEIEQIGLTSINADLPEGFQQVRIAVDSDGRGEFIDNEIEIVNLILEYDLGWGSLFSSTSDTDYLSSSGFDLSLIPVISAPISDLGKREMDILVEEVRFVSEFEGPFQILLGYYYEDRESFVSLNRQYRGTLPTPPPGTFSFDSQFIVETKQKSLFGELSYDISDQFVATLGFRSFDYDLSRPFSELAGVARSNQGQGDSADGTTYKFNLSYKPNDDTLIYAQWAEGFRMGDFQTITTPERDDPDGDGVFEFVDGVSRRADKEILDPDTTENYELGLKTSLADGRVKINGAIFRTNWEGLPLGISIVNGGATLFFNIGKSTVEGIELEVQAQLSESLVFNFSTSYIEAVLAEDTPQFGAEKGESLPGSADFNFSLGLEYQFNIAEYASYIRADYSYVDEYKHLFESQLQEGAPTLGGFSTLDLKVGAKIEDIHVDLFVKNLANSDEYTWVDSGWGQFGSQRGYRQKPRTIGLNVSYIF